MSDTKFTPGPWGIHSSGRNARDTELTRFEIAYGRNSYGDGPEGGVATLTQTTEANARLIASAPDLYEALIHAQVALADMSLDSPVIRHALPLVNAALAKARGQS